jgi:phosphatidylglycerophosphate synthase
LDGFIARRFNLKTIVGSIIDPMADKALMTVLTITLAMQDLLPRKILIMYNILQVINKSIFQYHWHILFLVEMLDLLFQHFIIDISLCLNQ